METRDYFGCALIRGLWGGVAGGDQPETRLPERLVRVHILLFLVGPKLEVGTKIREAVSYWSNLGHFGLIVIGVIV